MHHSCSPREQIARLEAEGPRFVFSVARRHFSVSCVLLSLLTTRLTEMSFFKVVLNFVLPRCLVRATRLRSLLFYIRLPLLSLTMYYAHIAPVPPFPDVSDVSKCVSKKVKMVTVHMYIVWLRNFFYYFFLRVVKCTHTARAANKISI